MIPDNGDHAEPGGWGWFEPESPTSKDVDNKELELAFSRCFRGADGQVVLGHLRQTILDRRLGPKSSDVELRFLEGQRSVVAYVVSMVDRNRP